MSDSQDPKYQKGYRAGREKTEAEMMELRARWPRSVLRRERFDRTFLVVLPFMFSERWHKTMADGTKIETVQAKVDIAIEAASHAVNTCRSFYDRPHPARRAA